MPRAKNFNRTPDVIAEVWQKRDDQKEQYPIEHDDQHGIEHFLGTAHTYMLASVDPNIKLVEPRDALLKAAATLVAAIERFDRMTDVKSS